MEWGCIGFLIGAIVCLVFFGMGVCYGGSDPEQSDDDSDVRIYVLNRHRDRSRNQRDNPPDSKEITDIRISSALVVVCPDLSSFILVSSADEVSVDSRTALAT